MADDPYVISINKFGSEARREVEQPARGEVVGGSKVHWRLGGGEAHWQLGTGRSGLTRRGGSGISQAWLWSRPAAIWPQ